MQKHTDYFEIYRAGERPSRYVGGEFGLPSASGQPPYLRVVMAFPDVYEVGMSHLGFRLLHSGLAERPDIAVERAFLPWPDLQRQLQRQGVPLVSLESQLPVAESDLLGLSLQYELAMPAVLKLLDLAGIPRRSAERAASRRRWPLVLLGGVGALNPEPISPFVDACFLGEADVAIHEIVDALIANREAPRQVQLEELSRIAGIYVPELVEVALPGPGELTPCVAARSQVTISRRFVEDLDQLRVPKVHLVPYCGLVHDRVAVEIQRGCSHGCRFCQAGFTSRPTRQRSAEQVLATARRQLQATGYQQLSLLSLSAGDHPCLEEMLVALAAEHGPRGVALSLPSLRTESLDPAVAACLGQLRRTTFTLAPEAATDRLRRVINKGNTEEDLLESVRSVMRAGYSQLKLYFMIGLPGETDDDVRAIAALARRLLAEVGRAARLALSLSTFVPKPHTPFQWEAALPLAEIQRRQALLVQQMPRHVELKWHDPGQSVIEAYLARGDRRLAAVLERVVSPEHSGLDAWTDQFQWSRWEQALQQAFAAGEIPAPERLLGAREHDAILPWEHLDVGVSRGYLLAQRSAAFEERTRADCATAACDACGVCPEAPLHRLASSRLADQPSAPALAAPSSPVARAVRLGFHKLGHACLISHLEMVGAFERALRRAALPLAFSGKFRPRPRLRFSPALPLGAESRCEFVELGLLEPLSAEEVQRRLARELPSGLCLRSAVVADADEVIGRIRGVRWRFELGEAQGERLARVPQLLAVEAAPVQRAGGKTVDVAQLVLEFAPLDPACFEVSCRFGPAGSVRPAELLAALLGLDEGAIRGVRVLRVHWLLDGSPVGAVWDAEGGSTRERA